MYLNGNPVGVQAATTVPDDIALELNIMGAHKGTNANHLVVDYFNTFQSENLPGYVCISNCYSSTNFQYRKSKQTS